MKLLLQLALFFAIVLTGTIPSLSQTITAVAETRTAGASVDLTQPLTLTWRYDSNLTLNLTPAFDDDRIYLPLSGGTIVSLRANQGQLVWRSEMGGEISASPAADQRGVYVATETGKPQGGARRATGALRVLGREGGVTLWMRTLAMPLRGALTLGNDKLFAAGLMERSPRLSVPLRSVWSFDYGSPFNSQHVVSGSRFSCAAKTAIFSPLR